MNPITNTQYLGPYYGHPDVTADVVSAIGGLLPKVNMLLGMAEADGVVLLINPATGCHISGSGNGGFRPMACSIGAANSKHKHGHGVDIYDPHGTFAAWCYKNADKLKGLGLGMENHRWTPSWCHLQDVPPGPPGSPWRLDFVPSTELPLCAALAEQAGAVA